MSKSLNKNVRKGRGTRDFSMITHKGESRVGKNKTRQNKAGNVSGEAGHDEGGDRSEYLIDLIQAFASALTDGIFSDGVVEYGGWDDNGEPARITASKAAIYGEITATDRRRFIDAAIMSGLFVIEGGDGDEISILRFNSSNNVCGEVIRIILRANTTTAIEVSYTFPKDIDEGYLSKLLPKAPARINQVLEIFASLQKSLKIAA